MAGNKGEKFLSEIGQFFITTGMRESCFVYLNTDEGWELPTRNATTHELMWDPAQYPSGIPAFTAALAAQSLKFGLYGAASGVTCGGVSGQLGYEELDVAFFIKLGVAYLKSDNCASYAMDSSVRFAATRDALLRANASIVYSIEPFSINPDIRQGGKLANLYRVAQDISGTYAAVLNRASIADKWAPLSGPGNWADPDMININTGLTVGENRIYFGLWCIMKSPLLLSANLPQLPADLQAIITNPEVVAINQDAAGVQARKLMIDGTALPWLVGFERCDIGPGGGLSGMKNRGWAPPTDTRVWSTQAHNVQGTVLLINTATDRCLQNGTAQGLATVVLLPCDASNPFQAWSFGPNAATVAALVHNASGLALAVGNSTLWSSLNGRYDTLPLPDSAYGNVALTLSPFLPTQTCTTRDCEGYHPEQLWYGPDAIDGFIAQSTYTASINHCYEGSCYVLTPRMPTTEHRCLAHVLSTTNLGTDSGNVEIWGGPLSGGAYVMALLFAGNTTTSQLIIAPFSALGVPGVGDASSFCIRDIWARADLGLATGSINSTVAAHDIAIFKLTPTVGGAC